MSHNVYCEDLKSKLTNMCKYLVLVENELNQGSNLMKKNEFIKILEKISDKEICCWDDNEITAIVEIAECEDKIVFGGKYGTTTQDFKVIKKIDLE